MKKYNGTTWVDTTLRQYKTAADTFTTLPADIYADGNNATVGISGNTVQNGTPTPNNPIMPQGTGERTGNLFDKSNILSGYEIGNNEIVSNPAWGVSDYIPIEQGKYYIATNTGLSSLEYETIGGTAVLSGKLITTGAYTPSENARFIRINFKLANLNNIMLNTGSTPLPYDPYGIKIPILSAGQTTPVYLGEVESTRWIKKLVLTGKETFGYANSCFTYTFDGRPTSVQPIKEVIFSNAYEGIEPKYRDQLRNYQCCITINYNQIAIRDDNYADAADFKSYLAAQYANGTPVCVWYVLAEPETGIVNEPLMKIGDYADEVSGISIPVTAGANTLSVDTTVQPSEVTVNYKGWHPVSDVHERENGQWD